MSAAAPNLQSLVYDYLVSSGFEKTAKKLKKESTDIETVSLSGNLVSIYESFVKNLTVSKRSSHQVGDISSSLKSSKKPKIVSEPVAVDESIIESVIIVKSSKKNKLTKKSESSASEAESEDESKKSVKKRKIAESVAAENPTAAAVKVIVVPKIESSESADEVAAEDASDSDVSDTSAAPSFKSISASSTPKEKTPKGTPFKRIDSEKIDVDHRLTDNSYTGKKGATDYGGKAARDLIVVRGKNFRHEKTKKKRATYRGGEIDFGVNSHKFED